MAANTAREIRPPPIFIEIERFDRKAVSDMFSPRISARHETTRKLYAHIREMCFGLVKKTWIKYANYAKNCWLHNRLRTGLIPVVPRVAAISFH